MSIKINLLPWREARREKRTRRFYGVVVMMFLAGIGLGLGVLQIYQQQLSAQQQRNAYITNHIERLNNEIADVQRYQATAARLGEQLTLFQTLQAERIALYSCSIILLPAWWMAWCISAFPAVVNRLAFLPWRAASGRYRINCAKSPVCQGLGCHNSLR